MQGEKAVWWPPSSFHSMWTSDNLSRVAVLFEFECMLLEISVMQKHEKPTLLLTCASAASVE